MPIGRTQFWGCSRPDLRKFLVLWAGHDFEVVVSKPWLDWTGTEEGDSHLVTLLKVHLALLWHWAF
jgi:hypothetical protein